MTQLIKYEAARQALTEAVMFDEVMAIMNVAEQAALYAKQANDNDLVEKATEIRVRAQRKAGEMLTKAKEMGQLADQSVGGVRGAAAKHGRSVMPTTQAATLKEIGISKENSSHWQQLASMSEEHFEAAVATAKDTAGQVTTAFMLREAAKAKPQGKPPTGAKADAIREELKAAKERGVSMLETYARLTLTAVRSQDSFTDQERSLLGELMEAIAAATA
jgi:hypothetical protein